ncbi:nucleotidyltransferase domain-containing protein [Bdellovibrionota bacterium FG-1]
MNTFGLTSTQFNTLSEILKNGIGPTPPFKAWVFGSRARGTHRPYSDLDLLIESTPPISPRQKELLQEAFEESDLPFKVDLVISENLLEAYRKNIMEERKILELK